MQQQNSTSSFNFQSDPRKTKFLDLFPSQYRSRVANEFCKAVRDDCKSPYDIVTRVLCETKRLKETTIYKTIRENLEAALEFTQSRIEWEALPKETKSRIKRARGSFHRDQYLTAQPPTEKQIKDLRVLGYKQEVKSKWEAMQLIEKLMK
jgi:hypothetical protein